MLNVEGVEQDSDRVATRMLYGVFNSGRCGRLAWTRSLRMVVGRSGHSMFALGYVQAFPALFPVSIQSLTLTPPTPAPITSSLPSQSSVSTSHSSCILSRCPGINVGMQLSFRRTFQYTGSGRDLCRCSSRSSIITVSLVSGAGVS